MKLSGEELQVAYHCASALLRSRQLAGQQIPYWLHRHYSKLDTAVRAAASESGHETGSESTELDLITAREVADMLKLSKRQAQRLAADLDGRIVGGRWLFRRDAVAEYAEGMKR